MESQWDELMWFAQIKERPALWLGSKSLLSLRDHLYGMRHAFSLCLHNDPMQYLRGFSAWYQKTVIRDQNGYGIWWNHILYTSGNCDAIAFDAFFPPLSATWRKSTEYPCPWRNGIEASFENKRAICAQNFKEFLPKLYFSGIL